MKALSALTIAIALVVAGCSGDSPATETEPGPEAAATAQAPAIGDDSPSGESELSATGEGCPVENFPLDAVNSYQQSADAGSRSPWLAVECTEGYLVVITNNIPNFEFVQVTPNGLQANQQTFEIPLEPEARSTPGAMGSLVPSASPSPASTSLRRSRRRRTAIETHSSMGCWIPATGTRPRAGSITSMLASTASSTTRGRWAWCTATSSTATSW